MKKKEKKECATTRSLPSQVSHSISLPVEITTEIISLLGDIRAEIRQLARCIASSNLSTFPDSNTNPRMLCQNTTLDKKKQTSKVFFESKWDEIRSLYPADKRKKRARCEKAFIKHVKESEYEDFKRALEQHIKSTTRGNEKGRFAYGFPSFCEDWRSIGEAESTPQDLETEKYKELVKDAVFNYCRGTVCKVEGDFRDRRGDLVIGVSEADRDN